MKLATPGGPWPWIAGAAAALALITILEGRLPFTGLGERSDSASSTAAASGAAAQADSTAARTAGPEWIERLDQIAQRQAAMIDRLEHLEAQLTARPTRQPIDAPATAADLEALREELREAIDAALATGASAPESAATALRDQVADTLADIRKDETVDAIRDYQDKRSERVEEDLARLEGWLELDAPQSQSFRSALLDQYVREEEQLRLYRDGVEQSVIDERRTDDGRLFYDELAGFLDGEQLSTFWFTVTGSKERP